MNTRRELVRAVHTEYMRWNELLFRVDTDRRETPLAPSPISLKDVLVHLKTWQEITIARLEAATKGVHPILPAWPQGLDPDSEENLDDINAWIFKTGRDISYATAYENWAAGFQHFIVLTEAIPENDWFIPGKFTWLPAYPLTAVVEGSLEHHREHREQLQIIFHLSDPGK